MINLTPAQEADRFVNRRRMAKRSFWMICACGLAIVTFALSSDVHAARVEASSWIITLIFGVWISIVLTYFGAASLDELNRRA